jgi:hypothetical protein
MVEPSRRPDSNRGPLHYENSSKRLQLSWRVPLCPGWAPMVKRNLVDGGGTREVRLVRTYVAQMLPARVSSCSNDLSTPAPAYAPVLEELKQFGAKSTGLLGRPLATYALRSFELTLTKYDPADLAGERLREVVDELDAPRVGISREPLANKRLDLLAELV